MPDLLVAGLVLGGAVVLVLIAREFASSTRPTSVPPSSVSPFAMWWFESVPKFAESEDAVVTLGEHLRRWDQGRASKAELDAHWGRAEVAVSACITALIHRPTADDDVRLVGPLLKTYQDAAAAFQVAAGAWWASDFAAMDVAWDRATELFDQATDRAAALARATRR